MNLVELGAFGELIGGVAVLITLVYLAAQVRQGNRQTAASLQLDLLSLANDIAKSTEDLSHAALLVKLKDDATLDPVESEQADAYVFRMLNFWHAAQQAELFGMMDPVQFSNVCADVERQAAASPGFRTRATAMLGHYPAARTLLVFLPLLPGRGQDQSTRPRSP